MPTTSDPLLPPARATTTSQVVERVTTPAPSWIPSDFFTALQSASYILVLAAGFLAWSSKKYFHDLIAKHFAMIETLREESKENLKLNNEQLDTIKQLTINNNLLSMVVVKYIKGAGLTHRSVTKVQDTVELNTEILEDIKQSIKNEDLL